MTGVEVDMEIASEETFGPVAPITRIGASTRRSGS